ncbi:hypothetical protein [Bosea sp. 2YAB26]
MADITATGATPTSVDKTAPQPKNRIPLLVWFGLIWIGFILSWR